jgi:hypothetical protein
MGTRVPKPAIRKIMKKSPPKRTNINKQYWKNWEKDWV